MSPDLEEELNAIQNRLDEVALRYFLDSVEPVKQEEASNESSL